LQCRISRNAVRGIRPDLDSSDRGRHGHAIVAQLLGQGSRQRQRPGGKRERPQAYAGGEIEDG
jgi:hypothetical protein